MFEEWFGDRKKYKKVKALESKLRSYVIEHPWRAIGVVLVAGMVMGKLTLGRKE